jgi:hypothetical protein
MPLEDPVNEVVAPKGWRSLEFLCKPFNGTTTGYIAIIKTALCIPLLVPKTVIPKAR